VRRLHSAAVLPCGDAIAPPFGSSAVRRYGAAAALASLEPSNARTDRLSPRRSAKDPPVPRPLKKA